MSDDAADQETARPDPGRLSRAALRALDAGLAAMEGGVAAIRRLRNRVEPAKSEEGADTPEGKRRPEIKDQAAAADAEVAAPGRKTLLHRFLVVVMCLLIGGAIGALTSHHIFSRQLDAQEKRLEFMQDSLDETHKHEMQILAEKRQLYKELAEHKKALNEANAEIEEHVNRIDELNKGLSESRGVTRSMDRGRTTQAAAAAQPRRAPKAGTCVTGATDPAGDLLDCIGKFNRR